MADIRNGLLVENNRVFFPSTNINIFPCSRRGQYEEELNKELKLTPEYYDPEARLNTERTNRLHTAVNGFTDSFIVSYTNDKLIFVLKGYYIEVKDFSPSYIASALGEGTNQIYAHLSLHTGISLNVESYTTEILYRQSTEDTKIKYLDVSYPDTATNGQPVNKDFFVGVSFTASDDEEKFEGTVAEGKGEAIPYFLPLFSKDGAQWQLIQTSLLPKIEHGETEGSIKVKGAFTVELDDEIAFEIGDGGVGTINVPMHLTKAAVIDGVTSASVIRTGALIAGEWLPDEHLINGTITAKTQIDTPTLKVNAITSDSEAITALKSVRAPILYQNIEGTDKQVPFIDIVEQNDGAWQLQISRAGKIKK